MDARPVCPHCGGPLFARSHGDLACVSHGHFFGSDLLESTFGLGSAAHAQHLATQGPTVGRRCPQDRLAMASVSSVSGSVHAEACTRCGSLWVPNEVVERLIQTTPVNAPTEAEARTMLALAAVRAVLTPAGKTPARR
jgi:hypothetical protein